VEINSPNNLIGGTTPGAGNLISGNGDRGILINNTTASSNRVEGNLIGTDITGTQAIGNALGIAIGAAANNVIGGTAAGARNLISGNTGNGIQLDRDDRNNKNRIEGNFIGTDITGAADLGNSGNGVVLLGVVNNVVGGTTAAARNVISGNNNSGVSISNFGSALLQTTRCQARCSITTAARPAMRSRKGITCTS
jgi:titin